VTAPRSTVDELAGDGGRAGEVGRLADPAAGLAAARAVAPRLAERADAHDRAGAFPAADFASCAQPGCSG